MWSTQWQTDISQGRQDQGQLGRQDDPKPDMHIQSNGSAGCNNTTMLYKQQLTQSKQLKVSQLGV